MLALMKRRWFLIIDYYNETKFLGVWNLACVCVCVWETMEQDNMGYSNMKYLDNKTGLTTEEEALWETVSVTVCSIFAMATLCPALVICSSWNKLCIEGKRKHVALNSLSHIWNKSGPKYAVFCVPPI